MKRRIFAANAGVETLVTRNGKGFKSIPIALFTPQEYLKSMS